MRTVKTYLPKTRFISLILSFLIIFYLIPTSVFADIVDENTVSDTALSANLEGSANDPKAYEVKELREENVKHFRLEDGTYLAAQYNYPVHYIDENGKFEDIDNRLSSSGSEFTTSNARIKFIKKFTGNENIFTLHENNTKITMGLMGAEKKTEGVVTSTNDSDDSIESIIGKLTNLENISSTIVYEDILDGVDIEYVVHSLNIKENIIVKERKDSYSYTFTVELNNLTAVLSDDGNVYISTEDGEVKYVIPAPIVYDANGEYAPNDVASYTFVSTGNSKYELAVTVSTDWMNDTARAFPVTIDPSIGVPYYYTIDLNVESDYPDMYFNDGSSLFVSSTDRAYWRASTNYLPDIPDSAYIWSAKLDLFGSGTGAYVGIYEITSDWDETLTWAKTVASTPQGTFGADVIDYHRIDSETSWYSFDITEVVKKWYSGESNYGLGLKLVDGTDTSKNADFFSSDYYEETDDRFTTPSFYVYYSDMKGLEDYYSYSSHSTAGVGVGSINLASGNLNFVADLVSTTDFLMPITVSAVYNSDISGEDDTTANSLSAYTTSYMPYGFKLNIAETIVAKTMINQEGSSFTNYILSDADGTNHYFYNETSNTYIDDSALGRTLTISTDEITITYKDQSKKTFTKMSTVPEGTEGGWVLTKITDTSGNSVIITLDTNYKPTKISLLPNGSTTPIDMIVFVYANGKIQIIRNTSSQKGVIFRYSDTYLGSITTTSSKYLREIWFAQGNSNAVGRNWINAATSGTLTNIQCYDKAYLSYNSLGKITKIADLSNNNIRYTWNSNKKVSQVAEYAGNTLGQKMSFTYGERYTDLRTTGNDETLNTSDDFITRYIFDNCGRVVSTYSSSADRETIYGAVIGTYDTSHASKNSLKEKTIVNSNTEDYIPSNNSGEYFATLQGGVNKTAETGSYTQTVFTASSLDLYNANMEYIISGFGYSDSITQNAAAKFSLSAKIYYYQGEGVDDVIVTYDFDFLDVENAWQFVSGKIDCKVDDSATYEVVRKIDVICNYYGQVDVNGAASYAYFDKISVINCSNMDSYRYYYSPISGNLIMKKNYHHYEYYEYNDKNSITRIANNKGEIYDFEYKDDGVTLETEYYYTFNRTGSFPGNLLYYYPYDATDPDSLIKKTIISSTSYTYNSQGSVLTVDTSNYVENVIDKTISSSYTYDGAAGSTIFGAMLTATDSRGHVTKYFYDSKNGNLLAEIDVTSGTGHVYTYDDFGRLEGVTPATGTATSYSAVSNAESVDYTYDSAHRLSSIVTDTTEYTLSYDGFSNSTAISAGSNTLATYEYNSNNGKLKKINYGNGFSEEYVYNNIEKVSEIWYNYSDGTRTKAYSYEYNTNGTLKKFTNHLNGEIVEYQYDYLGRLVSSSESKASNTSYKNEYTVQYDGLGYVTIEEIIIDYLVSNVSHEASIRTSYSYNYNGTLGSEETRYSVGGKSIDSEYTYDEFNRLTKNYSQADDFKHTTNYTYYSSGTATANLISTFTSTVNGTSITYNYTYDSKGNITRISDGNGNYVDYTYDDLGQLISETDGTVTWTYTYDNAGNITSITDTTVSETTDPDPGFTPIIRVVPLPTITTNTITLEYTNSEWGDLLTSYNGTAITYDAIGNPLSYYNGSSYTFTWEGRRLVGAVKGSSTMSFEYNDEGIRTSKTVNGVETTYYVNGSQIIAEKTGTRTIAYIYDASGTPIGMMYRTTSYAEGAFDVFWYEKNLQGDIIAVYNSAGTKVATYTYTDAWGNHTVSYSNGGASTGVVYNPFRYRSYYYDKDLGMYYLQSRYYDAKICRFISGDTYISTGQDIIGFNMFAYCGNNPVMGYDPTGHWDLGGVIIGTVLVTIAGIAAYFGSMSTETGALITGAVMATGVTMIAAAATDSQMVMDISGTSPLLNNLKHGYLKGGATLLIDFDNDEACFYIHGGVGYAESCGITGDISYGTGLIWNYDSPDDFSKTFLDVYAGGIVGLEYGVSPDKPITSATQSLSVTFSRARLNACSIGGGVDYYSYPIILFEWRK